MREVLSAERFLSDVESHKMTIIKNDGIHRHLKFRGERFAYWFEIISWPGCLCVNGDMGCYVFSRIEDMFNFFGMAKDDFNYRSGEPLQINAGYWSEKLVSDATYRAAKKYSQEIFNKRIEERFNSYFEDRSNSEEKEQCWEEIENQILMYSDDEHEAIRRAIEFKFGDFEFTDFWEVRCDEYTIHFIWCLYAIVWGIKQFRIADSDLQKAQLP